MKTGKKKGEGNYKDGKLFLWYKNRSNYKIGELNGLNSWHENGQKKFEGNFKDGKVVEGSRKFWNSKGEPVDTSESHTLIPACHISAPASWGCEKKPINNIDDFKQKLLK